MQTAYLDHVVFKFMRYSSCELVPHGSVPVVEPSNEPSHEIIHIKLIF